MIGKVNFKEEHQSLFQLCETAHSSCVDMQLEMSALRSHLMQIGIGKVPPGCQIEIKSATDALQRADFLLDYVRDNLKMAEQCFAMRDENGEVE